MADRIEELGRAKEGVLVTYRVAFDDGSTSIIEPSKHAIAYEWQTHTHLGKVMDQAAFGKAARAAKTATSVAKAAAPPTRGVRMEVACCDADHEGEWDGEWEECEVVAEHGDTCDVRIVEDDELCRGVPRRLVWEQCGSDAAAEAARPSTELAREAGRPAAVDGSVGARVEVEAEAEAAPSGHQAEQPPSRAVGLPSTDSRPVPTACQPPEGAAQQSEGTPTTTMPTSEVEGAAGAEEACTMVGNKVLPPGWKRRTDFGKFKGYVGPQGRKVQTVPLAWAAHAEMQEEARTQAGLAARAEAGEAAEAAARAEAELVEPSTDLVREAARPSTSSLACEVRAPLEAGTGVAATSIPASQRASPLALPPPLSTLLAADAAQTPRPMTPQTGAPAAPAAPAAPTTEKALPPPLSTLLTADVAQTPRPRTPQAGAPAAPAAPAAPTTEKEAAPEAVAARAKPVAAASQLEKTQQAMFEQMAHQRKQMTHQRERIAHQQEMAHQRQQAIAQSPALQQMRQQAQQQQLLLRQQQTRQQVQQQQMKVTPMQRVALQQMHAQQMMRLVAQHNEQVASPRPLATSPRHLALTMTLTQENNSTRARTQTSPPASLATRRSRR